MSGKFRLLIGTAAALLLSAQANATIVRVNTIMGSFDVNLYDSGTPATVANFLAYVNAGAYGNNMIFHRSEGGFVVQGGGFRYQGPSNLVSIPANAAVTNEPVYSNVRGTIAMAKLGGNVNSATNQWFINMGNNSANLDVQNGGFTVFGQVTSGGMAMLDSINVLQLFQFASPFDRLPLRNYTTQNFTDNVPITDQNVVTVSSVTVIDATVNTTAGLTMPLNTLINQPPPTPDPDTGGGGATGVGSLLALGMLGLWRQRRLYAR